MSIAAKCTCGQSAYFCTGVCKDFERMQFPGKDGSSIHNENINASIKEFIGTSPFVFMPTMRLRWSRDVFYNGSTGEHQRNLEQCFEAQDGSEKWVVVPVQEI